MITKCGAGWSIKTALAAIVVLGFCCNESNAVARGRLTTADVKQFLASYPVVKAIALRHAKASGQKIGSGKEALMAVVQAAADKTVSSEIETAVRSHGFHDVKDWSNVGQNIVVTYVHLKLSPSDQKNQQKIDKTIAKIEKNDLLSDKAKRKLIAAIRDQTQAMEPPPAADIAVVKPLVPEIDAVVKK